MPELPRQPGLPSLASTTTAGVVGLILVEGGADPHHADAELDRLLELRQTDSRVLGVVGAATPGRAVPVPRDGVIGVRVNVRGWVLKSRSIDALARLVAEGAAGGLPIDVLCGWTELSLLTAVLKIVPTARIVINHLGGPPSLGNGNDRDALASWRHGLAQLAAFSGCHIKLSGLATRGSGGAALLRWAVDAGGPARCVLGSDWPVTEALTGYGKWFSFVEKALGKQLDDGIAWANALRLYQARIP